MTIPRRSFLLSLFGLTVAPWCPAKSVGSDLVQVTLCLAPGALQKEREIALRERFADELRGVLKGLNAVSRHSQGDMSARPPDARTDTDPADSPPCSLDQRSPVGGGDRRESRGLST